MKQSRLKVKAVISTVLIVTTLLVFATGAILYFSKYGMWLIFTRKLINDVHALSALFMGIGIVIHFYLNILLYKREMGQLFKGESRKTERRR
jgi:cytochrome b subunit of formate dehydrogenase